jgi:formylglycine-generating enzyme required for sulfatase activity
MTYNFPTPQASLSDYRLDLFEITVGRFRAFVAAGKGIQTDPPDVAAGAHPKIAGSGWNPGWNNYLPTTAVDLTTRLQCHNTHATWTDMPGANEELPINCISWFEAFAFCVWDGGRLPTEMEWNYAAAGGEEQRAYPWGSGIDDTRAVYGCVGGNCPADFILAVGSKSPPGDGRWGQADMAGSMAEWTLDWYAQDYTEGCVDCANVLMGTDRVHRGGGFVNPEGLLLASFRGTALPVSGINASRYRQVGARCARNP